ncbi:MAG: spore maturation protein [Clostridiaceae bacterium]
MEYLRDSLIAILIGFVVFYGIYKKVKVYDCFMEGVMEGLKISIKIFPPILAMILAYRILSQSNALSLMINGLSPMFNSIGFPKELLPLVIIKPLSGSGSMGVFTEILSQYGVDSKIGIMAALIMGSTETIFYTLTVYLGSIKIKKVRHVIWAAILTQLSTVVLAVLYTNLFY